MADQGVGDRLKDLRRSAGSPTQRTVAKSIGCGYRSYQNWEMGHAVPRWKHAVALARYFGTTPTFILWGIDEDAPTRTELAELSDKLDRIMGLVETLATSVPGAASAPPAENPGAGESARRSQRAAHGRDRRRTAQEVVF